MSRRYIISDLHIGHSNISKFRGMGMTSEEHWERAFEGLEKLRKRDTVYLLGDIVIGKQFLPRMKEIQCNKVLIVGNHDLERGITMKDLVGVYDQVYSLHKDKGVWCTHAPMHPLELRGKRCAHGHGHDCLMLNQDGTQDTRYTSVCVEYAGYDPIPWDYALSDEYQQECWKIWRAKNELQL